MGCKPNYKHCHFNPSVEGEEYRCQWSRTAEEQRDPSLHSG
ncbi:hypothetical protein MGWOODY_Clf2647 [hydrothermal vent metagenome]|uniref:Uncharacterized protein n=1 Tax=hydrothermal vent metagenome TaxID=652676 RepID=A0A160VC80_9ZZZZ